MKSIIVKSLLGLGLTLAASQAYAQSCPVPTVSDDGDILTYTMGANGEHQAVLNLVTGATTLSTVGPIGGERETLTVPANEEVQAVHYRLNQAGEFFGEKILQATQINGARAVVYGGDASQNIPGFFAYFDGVSEGCLPVSQAPASFLPRFETIVLVAQSVINIGNAFNNSQNELRTCQADLATCRSNLATCSANLSAANQALQACNARVQELLGLIAAKDSEIQELKNQVNSAPTYAERNVIRARRSIRKLGFELGKGLNNDSESRQVAKIVRKGLKAIKGILYSRN